MLSTVSVPCRTVSYRVVSIDSSFTREASERATSERPKGRWPLWAAQRLEAGPGLSPTLPHPLNLPLASQLLGARGTYEGHSQRIRGEFCAHFPSHPSHSAHSAHSALHRSHHPKGSLRGGIPAPLQQPIREDGVRPVSILRNAICFPHPSVKFYFFPVFFACSSTLRMF